MDRIRKKGFTLLSLLLIMALFSADLALASKDRGEVGEGEPVWRANAGEIPLMSGDLEIVDGTLPAKGNEIKPKDGLRNASDEGDETEPGDGVRLTLEEALKRVDQNSPSLQILRYTWEMHQAEVARIQDQIASLGNIVTPNPVKLPTDPEALYGQVPNYADLSQEEKEKVDQTVENQVMINQSLNALIEAQAQAQYLAQKENSEREIERLKRQIEGLEKERSLTGLQEEEMRLGLRLMVLTHYVEILSLENQLAMNEAELSQLEADLKRADAYLSVQLMPEDERKQTKEALEAKRREREKLERGYAEKKAQFLLELGLPVDQDLSLAPMVIGDLEKPSPAQEVEPLVARLYPVRVAEEKLLFAKQVAPFKDETENQRRLREIQEKMAEADLLRVKREMEGKWVALYAALEKSYLDILDRQEALKRAQKEAEKVKRKLQVGIAAPYELVKASAVLKTKEIALHLQELAYHLARERLQYAKKGYME